jgi:hypothetical protein
MRWLDDRLHDLPPRPELETDPAAVAEATAPPPAFTATVVKPSSEPESAGFSGIGSAGNGAVGVPPADAPTPPGLSAPAATPANSEAPASMTASPDHDQSGTPREASEATRPDDPAPDADEPEPTKAMPTIGPGQRPSGLFDAEELDDESPPSSRAPKRRL